MKVLVTGGTGFVGSHTVAALKDSGHEVRVLARSLDRVGPALEPVGAGEVEAVTGDVTDAASVRAALDGCDAVIHAASVYSLDRRRDAEISQTNVRGTELVLGAAAEMGLDPIVHVSSVAALLGERGATLHPDAPPGNPPGAYLRSKADSERVARRFQDQGAPVVISYPASVWGPHDPYFGESCIIARSALSGAWRFLFDGGLVISDVRDVARLHAAVMVPGRGPRRYLATGTRLQLGELVARLSALTGRRIPTTMIPPRLVLGMARASDALQRVLPVRLPIDHQGATVGYLDVRWDDSATREELGIAPRDVDETIEDTLRWLAGVGFLPAKLAGRLAEEAPQPA